MFPLTLVRVWFKGVPLNWSVIHAHHCACSVCGGQRYHFPIFTVPPYILMHMGIGPSV